MSFENVKQRIVHDKRVTEGPGVNIASSNISLTRTCIQCSARVVRLFWAVTLMIGYRACIMQGGKKARKYADKVARLAEPDDEKGRMAQRKRRIYEVDHELLIDGLRKRQKVS